MTHISRGLLLITSTPKTSASILTHLKRCNSIRSLQQVHPHIIRKGCDQDAFLITRFISLCFSFSSNLSYPTSVFESVQRPNSFLWTALIQGYSRRSSSLDACLGLFKRMMVRAPPRVEHQSVNSYPFPSLISSCADAGALRQGQVIHGLVLRLGNQGDVLVGSSLIHLYGKCREIQRARKVFDAMPVRNEVSWTSLIVGYMICGDAEEAGKLFDRMPVKCLGAWNAMVSGSVKLGDICSARKYFDEMPVKDAVSYSCMIDAYAKAGDMCSAMILFEQSGQENDLILWSALISGFTQNGLPREAIQMFDRMQALRIKPDEIIMVTLMSACSQLGSSEMAKRLDSYLQCCSMSSLDLRVAGALVEMNVKCGNIERALSLFEQLPKRNVILYCSMIQGLSIHGHDSQAIALFDKMLKERIEPDKAAFTVILTACNRAGLIDESFRFFKSMVNEYLLEPSSDQYACIVDLLGRSGELQTAYKLLKSMPVEPQAGAWGALLGACKLHCELELAREIYHKLTQIEPFNAGNYLILSQIYAAVSGWTEVADLRGKIRDRGLRKIRGVSWWT